MQIGAFCPFFRSHKMIDAKDSEPWSYGEKVEEIVRNYISFRYKLMPYLYATFYEATQNGMPVARSLAINYTHDPMIYDWKYQNQYLFGQSIMVAPIVSYKEINKVYLPDGDWYDLNTERKYSGNQELYVETPMETLPLFVKGGAIIPMQSVVQNAKEAPLDTMYLHVYMGSVNNSFVYYEDMGDGYENINGKFYKRIIQFNANKKEIAFNGVEGSYASKFKNIKLILHGFNNQNTFKLNNNPIKTKNETIELIPGVSQFDPIGKSIEGKKSTVISLTMKNESGQFSVNW
jgi:alpha-glucosidase